MDETRSLSAIARDRFDEENAIFDALVSELGAGPKYPARKCNAQTLDAALAKMAAEAVLS